jgi:hypothetical protein
LHHVVTGVRTARQLLQTPASRQSRRGLDWTNFFIADIQIRFGTFVAFYLAGRAGAREALDWCSRAVASPACSGRFPAALADAVPWKRGLVGCGIVMICAGALILGIAPAFYLVFLAQILQGLSAERFEWHYTPKHGSWLDLAESELGVLSSQCLDRRIPDKQILVDEIAAWEQDRNAKHTKADWHFTTANARIKLKHLYPSI